MVCMLKHEDDVKFNPERLDQIFLQLGDQGALNVVCRAVEELAERLSVLETEFSQGRLINVRKIAKGLVGIADQIGMQGLAQVAGDVRQCVERQDSVALAATVSRLLRIGDISLSAVWDLQDLSG